MRPVYGHDETVADWAAWRLGFTNGFLPPVEAIGFIDREGNLTGAIVFNAFTGIDIEMNVVGRGAVSREAFMLAAKHIVAKGCARVTATARADNHRSIRIIEWGGFQREGIARKMYRDCDGVRFGMTAEELQARWIDGR